MVAPPAFAFISNPAAYDNVSETQQENAVHQDDAVQQDAPQQDAQQDVPKKTKAKKKVDLA